MKSCSRQFYAKCIGIYCVSIAKCQIHLLNLPTRCFSCWYGSWVSEFRSDCFDTKPTGIPWPNPRISGDLIQNPALHQHCYICTIFSFKNRKQTKNYFKRNQSYVLTIDTFILNIKLFIESLWTVIDF